MFTLILTLIVAVPTCSGPNSSGHSAIASVPGFESLSLCEQAGARWVQTIKQPEHAHYVCAQLSGHSPY